MWIGPDSTAWSNQLKVGGGAKDLTQIAHGRVADVALCNSLAVSFALLIFCIAENLIIRLICD